MFAFLLQFFKQFKDVTVETKKHATKEERKAAKAFSTSNATMPTSTRVAKTEAERSNEQIARSEAIKSTDLNLLSGYEKEQKLSIASKATTAEAPKKKLSLKEALLGSRGDSNSAISSNVGVVGARKRSDR